MMSDTSYLLASSPADYTKCHSFLEEEKIEHDKLSFPTVMAVRYNQVIGVLGTIPLKDAVVAGPMHIGVEGNPSFVLIHLIESYENVLRMSGISMYNFYVLKTDVDFINAIDRIKDSWDVKQLYTDQSDKVWFERIL